MKPAKYSLKNTNLIDLDTKKIYKYPTPTKDMDIARMVINGRHPQNKNEYILEHKCDFVMYILKGKGKVYAGDEIFSVKKSDVIFVPKENKFAVKGSMEYITFDSPAFYIEQSEEISI